MPRFKTTDDLERLTNALKRHGVDASSMGHECNHSGNHGDDPAFCTNSTHRCHHATHAYTGEACKPTRKSRSVILPKIDSGLGDKRRRHKSLSVHGKAIQGSDPLTLELKTGKSPQSVQLPTDTLDKEKKYMVTFTINQADKSNDS